MLLVVACCELLLAVRCALCVACCVLACPLFVVN